MAIALPWKGQLGRESGRKRGRSGSFNSHLQNKTQEEVTVGMRERYV